MGVHTSGQQGENERQWKNEKRTGTHATKCFVGIYDISSIKRVTRKFHVVVVQYQRWRNVQKSMLPVQSCVFFFIRPVDFFAVLVTVAV